MKVSKPTTSTCHKLLTAYTKSKKIVGNIFNALSIRKDFNHV